MLYHKCANHVTRIWKQAFICYPEKLNPVDHGWKIDIYQKILIRWSTIKPAPDAMMISCGCISGTYCHQLKCLDVCGCQNCSNLFEGDEIVA